MAAIEPIPTGPANPQVLTQTVGGPQASDELRGVGAAYGALADLGQQIREIGLANEKPKAEAAGAAAVSKDPDTGQITVKNIDHPILNELDAAYQHGAAVAFASQTESDQHQKFADLAAANPTDPQLFEAGASAYLKAQAKGAPAAFRADLQMTGQRLITQYRNGIAERAIQSTQEKAVDTATNLINTKSDEYVQLVAQPGGVDTPEAHQLHQEIANLWSSLADNPLTKISREHAQAEIQKLQGRATSEAILRQLDAGTTGLAVAEQAFRDPNLGLTPEAVNTLVGRAEAIQTDKETKRRAAEAQVNRDAAKISDEFLKTARDLKAGGRLTVDWIQKNRAQMNAADYGVAYGLLTSEGVEHNDPGVYADLVLAKANTPVPEYREQIARAVRRGALKPDTANSLLDGNATALRDDQPASPYRQGRNFVSSSLDANPFGTGPDFGAKKQTQANALAEYDAWAQQHPQTTADEALAVGTSIVQRYSLLDDAITPGAMGSPYGFSGSLNAVTPEDLARANARLKAAYATGNLSDAQYVSEVSRLSSWKRNLAKKATAAKQPKAP